MNPLLGWISPTERTSAQEQAHIDALGHCVKFALPVPKLAKGESIRLFDAWKDPTVVEEVGLKFNRFHQLTGSCFPAGTMVRMSSGEEKAIENINVGDKVVTHEGRYRSVVHTMKRNYTGDMIVLRAKGFAFPLEMTADHQVAIVDGDGILWKCAEDIQDGDEVILGWSKEVNEDTFIDTKPLLGKFAVDLDELMKDNAYTSGNEPEVPNVNISSARQVVTDSGIDWKGKVRQSSSRMENSIYRKIPICPSLGRLFGLYLAEGGCHEGRVTFTFHRKETETLAAEVISLVRGLFGVEGKIILSDRNPNTCTVRFQNVNLATVFKSLVPGNVYTKRVPGVFFHASEDTRLALVMGWMAGDGYIGEAKNNNIRLTGVSVCAALARDMNTLALSCGLRAGTQQRKAYKHSKSSYSVNLTGKKAVSLFPAVSHRAESREYSYPDPKWKSFGYARKVISVKRKPVELLPVYDFEVEEDHSFIAGGIVVHNCVACGGGNAVFSTIAMQRVSATNPTKAFLPFYWHNYALSRYYMGTSSQGEGSMGSTFAKSLTTDGIIDWVPGGDYPSYTDEDGISITGQEEMSWSSVHNSAVARVVAKSKSHLFGSAAECNTVEDIKAMLGNGYGVAFACDRYIGNASIRGTGANARVMGRWDGAGGHQQSIHAVEEHPDFGPILWAQNNWPKSVYPQDPGGGPPCGCWVLEKDVEAALTYNAEVYGYSHLNWFPAAPQVLDWSII